jgi:hypothetical protein
MAPIRSGKGGVNMSDRTARIFVAFGGKAKMFATKSSYLKWAVSTRAGWKHSTTLLFWRLLIRVIRIVKVERKERQAEDAVVAEFFEEHARVSKAWSEARRRGDPKALKYEKELLDSIASREHWNAGEFFEMHKKWYDEVYQSPPK